MKYVYMFEATYFSYLVVGLGGGIGAVLRFWVSENFAFPFGTLAVNVLGSFLIGIVFAIALHRFGERLSLFVVTGILGGFTTFSTFSLDVLKLFQADKIAFAAFYIITTFTASIFVVFFAVAITPHTLN